MLVCRTRSDSGRLTGVLLKGASGWVGFAGLLHLREVSQHDAREQTGGLGGVGVDTRQRPGKILLAVEKESG